VQFIDCVNRMLRINGFIRGDTDLLVSFSDTIHNSSSQLAQIAVQSEISELSARQLLPYQHKITGSLTMVAGQRTYALASDFVQMYGEQPFFYDSVAEFQVFQFQGGEDNLRNTILTYRTDPGYPLWFYFEQSTTQQVSFYPVPDAPRAGLLLAYDYGATVNVINSTDTIPLPTVDQQYAFTGMAARRFKFLYEGKIDTPVEDDAVYREFRSTLFSLIKGKQPATRYGSIYLSGAGMTRF
jgi:hypothetical protein